MYDTPILTLVGSAAGVVLGGVREPIADDSPINDFEVPLGIVRGLDE